MPEPINIFFAYARADQPLRDELDKHLAFLRRSKLIEGWYDGNISAGEEWEEAIDHHLHSADIILLLVSPDFIASDYCYDVEMRKALARHEAGEVVVVPVILRPCHWQNTPFAKFQALPKDALAITLWSNRDQAFASAAKAIDRVVRQLHAERNALPPETPPPPDVEPAAQSTPITAPALPESEFGPNRQQPSQDRHSPPRFCVRPNTHSRRRVSDGQRSG